MSVSNDSTQLKEAVFSLAYKNARLKEQLTQFLAIEKQRTMFETGVEVKDMATDATLIAHDNIVSDGAWLFLLCDKGAKKGTQCHFVKIICWWNKQDQTVKSLNLDSDNSDKKSFDEAAAVQYSLLCMFGQNNAQQNCTMDGILYGQAINSGRGGTGQSFYSKLEKLDLTAPQNRYIFSYCTLHCLQLTLSNAIKNHIGEDEKNF